VPAEIQTRVLSKLTEEAARGPHEKRTRAKDCASTGKALTVSNFCQTNGVVSLPRAVHCSGRVVMHEARRQRVLCNLERATKTANLSRQPPAYIGALTDRQDSLSNTCIELGLPCTPSRYSSRAARERYKQRILPAPPHQREILFLNPFASRTESMKKHSISNMKCEDQQKLPRQCPRRRIDSRPVRAVPCSRS
jgi:hypothetical protein